MGNGINQGGTITTPMQGSMRDQTLPAGKWEFDQAVTDVFDDMLTRSIPQYDLMRDLVTALAVEYLPQEAYCIDLGCSRGGALKPLLDKLGCYNHFIGVEVSKPMLEAARRDLSGWIQNGVADIREMDLRKDFPRLRANVFLSILTIQFIPIEYREQIIQSVFDFLKPGGAFIFVEKVLGAGAQMDGILKKLYYGLKSDHGYTQEQVDRKRMALEGVLVPVTAEWNEEMLRRAGFRSVDCFWRCLNFAGWLAVKGG